MRLKCVPSLSQVCVDNEVSIILKKFVFTGDAYIVSCWYKKNHTDLNPDHKRGPWRSNFSSKLLLNQFVKSQCVEICIVPKF
jgi:hypothetical protein